MEIVATHCPTKRFGHELRESASQAPHIVYELLSCPACQGVSLRSYFNRGTSADFSEVEFELLYPDRRGENFQIAKSIKNSRFRMDKEALAVMRRRLQIIHECNQKNRSKSLSSSKFPDRP
jgi:hypothetical protein